MKRILSILFALVLALSFSVMTATPVSAATLTVDTSLPDAPPNYHTIQEAVDAASDGDKIVVGAGEWYGAVVDKAVEIKGEEGAVINSGPVHSSGLIQGFPIRAGGSGATVSHFTFEVDFPIMAGAVDDVTVEHNVMIAPVQGVTNWDGSGWVIRHNVITELWDVSGGGLGIFIGWHPYYGVPASNNLVAFNKITGEFPEERDYSTTGICLMTYGGEITGNKVVHNDVLVTGWEAYAIGMTLSKYTPLGIEPETVLHDNKIGFNDLRGSTVELNFTLANPERDGYLSAEEARALMEENNSISRNLGENRAYDGVPAKEFRPVPVE